MVSELMHWADEDGDAALSLTEFCRLQQQLVQSEKTRSQTQALDSTLLSGQTPSNNYSQFLNGQKSLQTTPTLHKTFTLNR